MPGKRASPIVSMRLLLGGISTKKTSSPSSTLLPVRQRWATSMHSTQALLDSGAESNFMDFSLALKLQIPITSLTHKISVNALHGQELPRITHSTEHITLITSGNQSETISFLLLNSLSAPVVLGHPCLTQHSPRIARYNKWICLTRLQSTST